MAVPFEYLRPQGGGAVWVEVLGWSFESLRPHGGGAILVGVAGHSSISCLPDPNPSPSLTVAVPSWWMCWWGAPGQLVIRVSHTHGGGAVWMEVLTLTLTLALTLSSRWRYRQGGSAGLARRGSWSRSPHCPAQTCGQQATS